MGTKTKLAALFWSPVKEATTIAICAYIAKESILFPVQAVWDVSQA